ncbi:site-specific integrase [Kribbella yunnanensis]
MRPDLFAQIERSALDNGMAGRSASTGLNALTRIVLHTGRDLDQLTVEDIHEYRSWGARTRGNPPPGTFAAWDLLRAIGVLATDVSLRVALREGQRSTAELVDRYRIQCAPIRDVLIRYLNERRPALDYSSFDGLVSHLVGRFWADLEAHHPGIDSLRLAEDVAEAWKQRIMVVTTKHKGSRPRRSRLEILMRVRSFYLDIQEWALEDPSWAPFAVPCPIRRSETEGIKKQKKRANAAMHQRIRERLPHLPVLVDTAEQHRASQAALLAAARATAVGDEFEHGQTRYRRTVFKTHTRAPQLRRPDAVVVENLAAAELIDVQRSENEAFWAWAVIETLRHTGVRIEELLEITHLALVSYRLPDTGELVPLLQIVPSKVNEERLLLVGPELASVLATIVTRLRGVNAAADGQIRLTCRYDQHERVTGPPLPHLFQRKIGYRHEMITPATVQHLLSATLTRAGLTDATGEPLRYTPHDFRRMFATDAVTGGLPVHIAARVLGHHSLSATQAYLAVFQDDLVRTYRSFLDQRRATRPVAEYREPTDEEWSEFQQHFQLRKLELGTCGRPYGTPCQHEHACLRCPSLRVDLQQRPRVIAIIHNLRERITEARMNGWLGEVQGLQTSLDAAQRKLAGLDKAHSTPPASPVQLGMPTIAAPQRARP